MPVLVDWKGKPITRVDRSPLGKQFTQSQNIFEGVVNVKVYDDAISAKGRCAFCHGPVEGVLRFPKDYKLTDNDMIEDARDQILSRIQKIHYCIPRLDGPKIVAKDWLEKFH